MALNIFWIKLCGTLCDWAANQAFLRGSIDTFGRHIRLHGSKAVRDMILDSITNSPATSKGYPGTSGRANLDASSSYSHVYRESGRFGSYPSHDNFDDESGPD